MASLLNTAGRVAQEAGTGINYGDLAVNILVKFLHVLEAALIIAVGFFAIRYMRRYLQKIQVLHESQRMALNLLEKITAGFLVVITITLALKVVGLDLTMIISALTLGLSFGLRDVIKNYVSGVLILFKSPFAIGDVVKIRSHTGRVEKIDFQSTTLKTFDKKEVTIYNKDVLTQSIVNYSKDEIRRVEIAVTLGHGTDVSRAFKIFDAILQNDEKVLKDPRYSIVFGAFNDFGIKVMLRFWVQRSANILKVRSKIALQIQEAFDEQKLFMPYNRTVQFESDISMNEDRKQRIVAFYGKPALATIAVTTNGQVETTLAQIPAENAAEADEPEIA